jgi:hypothetical protein
MVIDRIEWIDLPFLKREKLSLVVEKKLSVMKVSQQKNTSSRRSQGDRMASR